MFSSSDGGLVVAEGTGLESPACGKVASLVSSCNLFRRTFKEAAVCSGFELGSGPGVTIGGAVTCSSGGGAGTSTLALMPSYEKLHFWQTKYRLASTISF